MIAERRAGVGFFFVVVVLVLFFFFLSPLLPCQRRTCVTGLFSKKISQTRAEGAGHPSSSSLSEVNSSLKQNPRSNDRVSPESEDCGSSRDLLLGNRDLGYPPPPPVPITPPTRASRLLQRPAGSGTRGRGGGGAERKSLSGRTGLKTLNEAFF